MIEADASHGRRTAAPKLIVRDAAAAIEFYRRAFDAVEALRLTDPAGKVVHAELEVGGSAIMVGEETPAHGNLAPPTLGGSPVHIHLDVEDVDAVAERAVTAGARVVIPVADQFYGDRSGRLEDPFGHLWIVATRLETLSQEEMQARFDAFMEGTRGG